MATTVERLEAYADEVGKIHVIVDGEELFEWGVESARENFRNLLGVMYSFATQFAEDSLSSELSPYRIICVVNPSEFTANPFPLRLETTNTASEQRFVFSKV